MALPFATEGNVKAISREVAKEVVKEDSTKVIANPTLVGTESALSGLQVGDEKFKIPEGALIPIIESIVQNGFGYSKYTIEELFNKGKKYTNGGGDMTSFLGAIINEYGSYSMWIFRIKKSASGSTPYRVACYKLLLGDGQPLEVSDFIAKYNLAPTYRLQYSDIQHGVNLNQLVTPTDASSKTYVPKLINGTLTWVEETA